MTGKFCISLVAISLGLALGCSKNATAVKKTESAKSSTTKTTRPTKIQTVEQLDNDAVLVKYGTATFTKSELLKLTDLRIALIKLSSPQNTQNLVRNEAFTSRIMISIPTGFPRDCAVEAFLSTNGIEVSQETVTLMRKRVLQAAKQPFISWESFLKKLSEADRATLLGRIENEAKLETLRKWYLEKNPIALSEEEIAGYHNRLSDYNAMAAATNAATFVMATNVWRELKGGLAFTEAVGRYSTGENDGEDGEWGDFEASYFNDEPALKAILATMQPGDFSPPMEGDNGLMIVKVDDINTESAEPRYSLSRIFFHLPEFYPELNDEEFRTQLLDAKKAKQFNSFLEKLIKLETLTYPSGEEIFENARRIAAQPVIM